MEKNKKKIFCEDVLRWGLYCDGSNCGLYCFFGYFDSYFWERKCYFMNVLDIEIYDFFVWFGDFVNIINVWKCVSEIGLLFVLFEYLVKFSEDDIGEEFDVKGRFFEKMFCFFINGCGFMFLGFIFKVWFKFGVDYFVFSVF